MSKLDNMRLLSSSDTIKREDGYILVHILESGDIAGDEALVTLRIGSDGSIRCLASQHVPEIDWEPFARAYERALRYSKMVCFLRLEGKKVSFLSQYEIDSLQDGTVVYARFSKHEEPYGCRLWHGVAYSLDSGSNLGALSASEHEVGLSLSDFLSEK